MATQDPRNLGVASDQPMVSAYAAPRVGTTTVFWRVLERIGKMQGGTSETDAVIDNTDQTKFHQYFLRSTATGGTATGFYMTLDGYDVGAVNTMHLWAAIKKAGAVSRGGSALDATFCLPKDFSVTGVIGEAHPIYAHLRMEDEVRNIQGTYCGMKMTNQIKVGNVLPAGTFFIRYYDTGPVWTPFLFGFSGVTPGVGRFIEDASAAAGVATWYLRCRMTTGATGYIPVYNAHMA